MRCSARNENSGIGSSIVINARKKLLGIMVVVSAVFLCMPSSVHAAFHGTFYRKGLGIVGAGLVVHGLWKITRKSPGRGLLRILAGTVVAVGGICSDIIGNRVVSIIRRISDLQQRNAQREQTLFKSFLQDVRFDAETFYHGGAETVGNVVQSENQLEEGVHACKKGNIITGVDQIYDGVYHNIRARCRMLLYPELWRQQ